MKFEIDVRGRGAGKTYDAISAALTNTRSMVSDSFYGGTAFDGDSIPPIEDHEHRNILLLTDIDEEITDEWNLKPVVDFANRVDAVYVTHTHLNVIEVWFRGGATIKLNVVNVNDMDLVKGMSFYSVLLSGTYPESEDFFSTQNKLRFVRYYGSELHPKVLELISNEDSVVRMNATLGL